MPRPLSFTELGPLTSAVLAAVVICAIAALVLLLYVWQTRRSLRMLRRSAIRFARGDLSQRVEVRGSGQLAMLADTLNQMARQLEERLSTVVQQRNELGAVLSSMVEGVVAIDLNERVISLNRAAAELLQLDPRQAIGRSIQEVIRNSTIQDLVTRTLRERSAFQGEVELRVGEPIGLGQRYVQYQSAILHDAEGRHIGLVIVLHDVTQLRRLESVRRDFVANVSHEVKTPVAAIKAAVETLLDEPTHDPQQSERFLHIVQRQADRLAAIVEDLLALARIEQARDEPGDEIEPVRVRSILLAAGETCQAIADEKRMRIHLTCEDDLHVAANGALIEQAVVNLIDNAIKYSNPGGEVRINAQRDDQEVVLSVSDAGRGIEPVHLPRIFERFYRTDKARSRELGGTGLGLSIVKHIAELQGGRVSVDSIPDVGSTFRIHLATAAAKEQAVVVDAAT